MRGQLHLLVVMLSLALAAYELAAGSYLIVALDLTIAAVNVWLYLRFRDRRP